jgi:curved DNA-binding protein
MTDYYSILGVDRGADQNEIKQAYRKMAAKHHPDRGGDTAEFQKIQSAYDTLSNPQKRSEYDNPQPQFGGPGGFHFHSGGGMPPGFEDIFSQFAGFGGPQFGFGFRQQSPRNKTLNIQTIITLEEAFEGKNLIANLTLPSGKNQTIEVKIPAGIQDGTTLRLNGMGDDSLSGQPRGDIHLTVNIHNHSVFRREGDDLIMPLVINAIDAILGKTIKVKSIDGKKLEVNINPGTQHGHVLALQGYGMPNMNDNRYVGRLLLPVEIEIPTNLSETQKDLLKRIFI